MNQHIQEVAKKFFKTEFERLHYLEQQVVRRFSEHRYVSRNTNQEFAEQLTFGQRLADRIASIGGSWFFIILFLFFITVWIGLNSTLLVKAGKAFDPYPYILLNLMLSLLAALQAPVIMMSQNRLAAKDRLEAAHGYEVNLKAELEVRALHEKLDQLREKQWLELIQIQQEQIRMLGELLSAGNNRSKQ